MQTATHRPHMLDLGNNSELCEGVIGYVQPFEAKKLPELPTDNLEFTEAIQQTMTAIAGFPHAGASADALIYAVRFLRENPAYARALGIV